MSSKFDLMIVSGLIPPVNPDNLLFTVKAALVDICWLIILSTRETNISGFTSLFMMEKMGVMKDANIIKVDGVSANEETVKSGEYPICFDYCVYIRADSPHDSPEYILFTWLQDGAGAAFISSQSYLPAR